MSRKLKTGWVIIATSGATVDGSGRIIEKQWLQSMADNYDPQVFTAKLWPDHYRFMPVGGEVLALKVEEATNENLKGEIHLKAIMAPNDWLIEANRNGQYVHTSIEVREGFMAGKFDFYLGGLGVTDNEASAGTQALEFCAGQDQPDYLFKGETINLAASVKDSFFASLSPSKNTDETEMNQEQFKAFTALIEAQNKTLAALETGMASLEVKFTAAQSEGGSDASEQDDNQEDNNQEGDKAVTALQEKFNVLESQFNALSEQQNANTELDDHDGDGDGADDHDGHAF